MNATAPTAALPLWSGGAAVAVVCTVVALVWSSALNAGFVFDDFLFLDRIACWQIDEWRDLPSVTSQPLCSYRKLRFLSLAVDHILWGRDAFGYHLTNLVLHICTTGLVLTLLRRWIGSLTLVVFVTLVWALHPVHADTVTYVSGRRDLLTTMFFVTSALLWPQDWTRMGRAALRSAAAAVSFVLAMFAKEMAVTLPVIIVLMVWVHHSTAPGALERGRVQLLRAVLRFLPWALPVVVVAAWSVWYRGITHSLSNASGWYGGDLSTHVMTMLAVYGRYLELVVWPWRLLGDYQDFPYAFSMGDPRVWPGIAFLGLLWAGGGWLTWRGHRAGLGLLWFAVTMLPVSQILVHHELMAEHYLYLPMIGLAIALGATMEQVWPLVPAGRRASMRAAAVVTAVTVLSLQTWRVQVRNDDFVSNMTFRQAMLEHVSHSFRGRRALASEYAKAGNLESAAAMLQELLNSFPPTTPEHAAAAGDLAQILADWGQLDQAIQLVEVSLSVSPDAVAVKALRGSLHLQMGEPAAAVPWLEQATAAQPGRLQWQVWLAMALSASGRVDDALSVLDHQQAAHRGTFLLHMVTGDTLAAAARLPEAAAQYELAAAADPSSPVPWQRLTAVWTAMQQPERAQQADARARSLDSRTP